jgi:hypothetical protein
MPEQFEDDVSRELRERIPGIISLHYYRRGDYIYNFLILMNQENINFSIWDFYNIIDDVIFEEDDD